MITIKDLNPKGHTPSQLQMNNLVRLWKALAPVESKFYNDTGIVFKITSGLRTEEEQLQLNPAHPKSAHVLGLAADVLDLDKSFWDWCMENMDCIIENKLYLEDKLFTPKHVHLTLVAPKSGNRVFKP